jgi:hypothetical protein
MTQPKDITFEGSGSHFITLGARYAIEKEEVYLYFSATWLGKPIRFTQCIKRTQQSRGLGEYTNYVVDANYVDEDRKRLSELSWVARSACDTATTDAVQDFLTTDIVNAKTAYRDSAAQALVRSIQRLGKERFEPWQAIRSAVSLHRMRLSFGVESALLDYATKLEAVDDANAKITETLERESVDFNGYTWKSNKVDA